MTTAIQLQSFLHTIDESGDMLAFKRNQQIIMEKYGYDDWSEAKKDKKAMAEFKKLDEAPIEESKMSELDIARQETDTNPSEEAIRDENYKKGTFVLHGLTIDIENPKGSIRSGTSPDGEKWSSTMTADYGEIRDTESADGDAVDIFIGDDLTSEVFYVVDQIHKDGTFDEQKVIAGVNSREQAEELYLSNYEKGWNLYSGITTMSLQNFIKWVNSRDSKKPAAESEFGEKQVKMDESNMNTATKLKDICESLEQIDEAITLTWKGTKNNSKWIKAVSDSGVLGKFKKESSIKIEGKKHWILVFSKGSLIGKTNLDKPDTGQILYASGNGSPDSSKTGWNFVDNGDKVYGPRSGIWNKIPDNVKSFNQLKSFLKVYSDGSGQDFDFRSAKDKKEQVEKDRGEFTHHEYTLSVQSGGFVTPGFKSAMIAAGAVYVAEFDGWVYEKNNKKVAKLIEER